ncbi:MAG: PIN domain-containing protein [Candidatus Rokuibacteriota bacterium]
MAIGLDTSVVVRLLIGEPRSQVERARHRIDRALAAGETILVTDLVAAESYHALRHHYAVPEGEALSRLRQLFESRVVRLEPPEAMGALTEGRGEALVDRLVVARYRGLGAVTVTLDRKQGRLEGAVPLRG